VDEIVEFQSQQGVWMKLRASRRLTVGVLAVVLGSVLGAVGCSEEEASGRPPGTKKPVMNADGYTPPHRPHLAETPEAALETLASIYRLKPDQRFMLAFGAIARMQGRRTEVQPEFREGRWHFLADGTSISDVAELPGFDDLYGALLRFAEQAPMGDATSTDVVGTDLLPPSTEAAARILRDIDREWKGGEQTRTKVLRAAGALAVYLLGTEDRLETSDAVAAQALAALALSEASGANGSSVRALLARLLGYPVAAAAIAEKLPRDDVIRMYARSERNRLATVARARTFEATPAMLYLDLLDRDGAYDQLAEEDWSDREDVSAELRVRALFADSRWSSGLEYFYLASALGEVGSVLEELRPAEVIEQVADAGEPWELLPKIEAALGLLSSEEGGPFLPDPVVAAYYRAHIFSALRSIGWFEIVTRGSIDATASFKSRFGGSASGYGQEVLRYLETLEGARTRGMPLAQVATELRTFEHIGGGPLFPIAKYAKDDSVNPVLLQVIRAFAEQADTRVEHRSSLARLAWMALVDLPLSERLARSVVAEGGDEALYVRAWMARLDGDSTELVALLGDPKLTVERRLWLLGDLDLKGLIDPSVVRRQYEILIEDDPASWSRVESYVDFLEETEEYETALRVLGEWFDRPHDAGGLNEIVALTSIARLRQKVGRLDEAAELLGRLERSYYGGAMMRAALIRAELGDEAGALRVAEARLDRYRDSRSAVHLAGLRWQFGDFDGAARTVIEIPGGTNLSDWSYVVGPRFAETFSQRPAEAKAAVQSLVEAGVGVNKLRYLGAACWRASELDVGLAVAETLVPRGSETLRVVGLIYALRRDRDGEMEAREWLEGSIPPQMRNPMSMIFFERGQDEPLWDFFPEPLGGGPGGQYIWLLRAVSFLRADKPIAEHRERLDGYYSPEPRGFYDHIGRYLMDLETMEEVWAAAGMNPKRRAEAIYFFGIKAQSENDVENAVRWYRVAVESGRNKQGEVGWSYHQLLLWVNSNQSVARLGETLETGWGREWPSFATDAKEE